MIQDRSFSLFGGLDLTTSQIGLLPGKIIAGQNYEAVQEGYRRFKGYERFDGRPKPSDASYWVLDFDAGTAEISEGDTVTGGNSGATGVALIDAVVESGTYGGSDAAGYLVLTAVDGTFEDDEDLEVSATPMSVADGTAAALGADNDTDSDTWLQDAIETARTAIQTVTGSGVIRGVWVYGGNVYAFRDNAGGTAGVMYKATTSGWSAVSLGYTVDFTSGGTTEIAEGDTVTGSVSGSTATVKRVIVTSGTWAGGDAAGRLILSGPSAAFQAENLLVSAVDLATIAGDLTAITLPAGGRYEFVNYNFGGHAGSNRMYGANGVGTAFEFDGTTFVPIITGMTTDTPTHVTAHKKQLFLSFSGGSLQNSAIADPYTWTVVTGASEIGIGEEITGIFGEIAGVLVVLGLNKIKVLYGNDSSDFSLNDFAEESGAVEYTAQKIGTLVLFDNRGLRDLQATQNFGNFKLGTITAMISPWLKSKKDATVTPVASVRVRADDIYRVYFSDSTVLSVYFGRKQPECTVLSLDHRIYCICSGEDSSGNEVVYFGSDDGYVYQSGVGNSFDGTAMTYFIRLPFWNAGSPTHEKRWPKIVVETDCGANADLNVSAEVSYGAPDSSPVSEQSFAVAGGGGFWDEANWDEFYWSSQVIGLAEAHVDAIGTNLSVTIGGQTTYDAPHTLKSITYHYSQRRRVR